jgi:4-amino-4-deoxy-L-arabinose transferase-like glycosyltransferase
MLHTYSIKLEKDQSIQYIIGFLCLVVYVGALCFPLMDKDAAHHANIALYMYEHHNYVNLVDRGSDYLDKPHLLFWTSQIRLKIFGINTFAHRLPALLFALLSVYSTYKLARHLTNRTTAQMAALMLATAQAFVLSIVDARMETPLTAGIIFGLWHMIVYVDRQKILSLFLAALGAAMAFSAKGWLGPVIIFVSVISYIFLTGKWRIFTRPKTWLFLPVFFLLISPVLYAYYLQYDLHPEKIIRGTSHRSGVRFILWDQLFERAKGFDEGGRNSSYFFLYHTFLWAFFPWSIMAYLGLVFWIRRIFFKRRRLHPLGFAAVSFAFLLVSISFSKFKMPHYIIMLLPLAALFTAPYLRFILSYRKGVRFFYPLQLGLAIMVLLATILLNYYFFPPRNTGVLIFGSSLLILFIGFLIRKYSRAYKVFYISAAASVVLNFFMNYNFFPSLLQYQGGNELVKMMEAQHIQIADSNILQVEPNAHSFDFYRNHNHPLIGIDNIVERYPELSGKYFLITNYYKKELEGKGFVVTPVVSHVDFNVATIRLSFLNPATRMQRADTLMLVKVYRR